MPAKLSATEKTVDLHFRMKESDRDRLAELGNGSAVKGVRRLLKEEQWRSEGRYVELSREEYDAFLAVVGKLKAERAQRRREDREQIVI